MNTRILVWDLPTRIFHWSLALSFAVAFLTAESERGRDVHVLAGYAMLGLLGFRLVWGFAGSRYARFAEFVRGPRDVIRYLRSIRTGKPRRSPGHNPMGAVAIIALIVLGLASSATGWLLYDEVGGEWMEELHEIVSDAMLVLVVMHIAGVLLASRLYRENLILAMVTGRKRGTPAEGIPSAHVPLAVLLVVILTLVLALGWSARYTAADETRGGEANAPTAATEPDRD